MQRFTLISTFALIALSSTTIPISASSHEVTPGTPHGPLLQPRVMNNTIPTAYQFYLKIDGFEDKTILTFGKLESALTLQIPLSEIDTKIYEWIKTTLPKSEGGQGKVTSNTVRTASLLAYNAEGREVLRWKLTNAWIKAYKVSNLDAASIDSAVAILEMAFDNIQQVSREGSNL